MNNLKDRLKPFLLRLQQAYCNFGTKIYVAKIIKKQRLLQGDANFIENICDDEHINNLFGSKLAIFSILLKTSITWLLIAILFFMGGYDGALTIIFKAVILFVIYIYLLKIEVINANILLKHNLEDFKSEYLSKRRKNNEH
jgi:hypothetical protein